MIMRKVVYKSSFIKSVILIVALLAILCVYPLGLITHTIRQCNPALTEGTTEVINYLNNASQVFVANDNHIQYVDVKVYENTYADSFTVSMYDTNLTLLATQKVEVPDELPGYARVLLDVDVTKGELYTLRFSSVESLYLGQEPWYCPDTVAVSYYNTTLMEGMNLVMDYEYRVPYDLPHGLFAVGVIVLIALILTSVLALIFKEHKNDKLITIETGLKWVLNPLVGLLLAAFVMAVALGYVSKYAPDKIFALIGAACVGLILFYGINHDRTGTTMVIDSDYIVNNFPRYVQIVAIAGAIQACCAYVAGLYDINHYVAERKQLLWFALAIIAMMKAKDIFNLLNLVYFIVAGAIGTAFYVRHAAENTTKDEIFVLRATVIIAILLGLIVIRTIRALIEGKRLGTLKEVVGKLRYPAVILVGAYLVLSLIFRNTRYWLLELVIGFTLLFINYLLWEKRDTFVINVMYGVVLQFCLCTVWVWLRRPYSTNRCARYTHYFHTETVTATYLTMVACVAIVLLLSKIRKTTVTVDGLGVSNVTAPLLLKHIWKELCLFGVVMSYLIFTMARTAYFAIAAAVIFAFIYMIGMRSKDMLVLGLKSLGLTALAVIIAIPAVFEIQRTLPCLYSDPYEYDIEFYEDQVMRGRQLNADEYMTVGRLTNIFFEKLLGKETHFDLYYNDYSGFDEYHATFRDYYTNRGYTWPSMTITDDMWDNQLEGVYKYAALFDWSAEDIEKQYKLIDAGLVEPDDAFIDYKYYGPEYEYLAEDEFYATHPQPADEEPSETEATENASTDETTELAYDSTEEVEELDYTNGRIDIYKSYIEQLNMTGHDTMGAILNNGEVASHAHDVYLQVAFDNGIPTAIVFALMGICLFISSISLYKNNKADKPYMAVTTIVIIGFAVAGVVEWTYHFSHPMAFVMWLLFTPLLRRDYGRKETKV